MVDAADSIVFRQLFNSLRLAYEPAIAALGPVLEAEVDNVDGYRALAEAVAADERVTGSRRRSQSLGQAWSQFGGTPPPG